MTLQIGIQGGRGSFNEEAILSKVARSSIVDYTIEHFHTTADVIAALMAGTIDTAQFAIRNTLGGEVIESIEATKNIKYKILDEYSLKISHTLLIHSDAHMEEITTIMTHPQVLLQCQKTLKTRYSHLNLTSGEGALVDHAKVAEQIMLGKIQRNVGTIGSTRLSDIYNLKIIESNLQDSDDNYTNFLYVSR